GKMKLIALLVLQPIPIINSFWSLSMGNVELLALPFLGALSLVVGGTAAIAFIKGLRIPPYRAGSVFTAGMFTNIGIFGALIGFVLYGPIGFTVVQLVRVFEEPIYYAIGFPLSQQISAGGLQKFRFNWMLITDRPIIAIPIGAIVTGTLLNVSGLTPPQLLATASGYIVPVMTAMLGSAIGLTLRVTKMGDYKKEISLVMLIKYAIVPAVIIPAAWLLGLGQIMDGIPFKMMAIISFLPTGFIALVPPVLYDFDLDLANSAWLVTTLALLLVFPIVYFVVV
ncbi:MAG: hypothetical protein ACOCW6_02565, partial [Spirochaetota bacterium]